MLHYLKGLDIFTTLLKVVLQAMVKRWFFKVVNIGKETENEEKNDFYSNSGRIHFITTLWM